MLCAALLALAQSGPVPDPLVVTDDPVVLVDNYDVTLPSACEGYPFGTGCHHTLVAIYYPDGTGPHSLGYSNPPSPVWINLRGGNTNPAAPEMYAWFQENVLPLGFVGVDPNFPEVQPGEDYTTAAEWIATLIQFLRHHHEWLNIDPDRIFLFGRSFGGFLSLTMGLKEDYQDLSSPDPMKHHSSRPDFLVPFSPPTDLTCFDDQVLFEWLMTAYFPVSMAPGATEQQKLEDSPIYWLANPQLYGRTETPPMCLGYKMAFQHPCGEITDPHDSSFGIWMRDAVDEYVVASGDAQLGLGSVLLDTSDLWGYGADMTATLAWAQAQLQPKVEQIYLVPPKTPIGPAGSLQELTAVGAKPGNFVYYFFGFDDGPVVVPGCPDIHEGIPAFFYLGASTASAEGKATFQVMAPPIAIGIPIVFHAVDLFDCRVSNVMNKTWEQ